MLLIDVDNGMELTSLPDAPDSLPALLLPLIEKDMLVLVKGVVYRVVAYGYAVDKEELVEAVFLKKYNSNPATMTWFGAPIIYTGPDK